MFKIIYKVIKNNVIKKQSIFILSDDIASASLVALNQFNDDLVEVIEL